MHGTQFWDVVAIQDLMAKDKCCFAFLLGVFNGEGRRRGALRFRRERLSPLVWQFSVRIFVLVTICCAKLCRGGNFLFEFVLQWQFSVRICVVVIVFQAVRIVDFSGTDKRCTGRKFRI